jgi:hypothetical protein
MLRGIASATVSRRHLALQRALSQKKMPIIACGYPSLIFLLGRQCSVFAEKVTPTASSHERRSGGNVAAASVGESGKGVILRAGWHGDDKRHHLWHGTG